MPGAGAKVAGSRWLRSLEEFKSRVSELLGMTLVTHQTGPEGKKVLKVLIEEGVPIAQELYLGIVVDRARACPAIMASRSGGMDIEEVAEKTPHLIHGSGSIRPSASRPFRLGISFTAWDCPPPWLNPG